MIRLIVESRLHSAMVACRNAAASLAAGTLARLKTTDVHVAQQRELLAYVILLVFIVELLCPPVVADTADNSSVDAIWRGCRRFTRRRLRERRRR